AGVLDAPAAASGDSLTVALPEIAPGGEAWVLHYLATSTSTGEESSLVAALRSRGVELVADTKRWWDAWFRTLLEVRTPEPRVNDLVDDTLVSIKLQQSMPGGGVSPMVSFRGVWIRDSAGPVKALL